MSSTSSSLAPAPGASTPAALGPLVLASLAATWVVWGSTYLAIKWALESFPPFHQMGTRFLAAGVLLGAWARWRGAGWPSRDQWASAAVLGALMLGGGYGLTAVAADHVASGLVVAFIAVVPALVALLEWPYGERPRAAEWAGIALGLAGTTLLASGQGFGASATGLLAIAAACLTWTLGTVWARHGLPGGRSLALAPGAMGYASQMALGGVLLMAMSWAAGEQPAWPPTPRALWCWGYLVVAGSLVTFTAYMLLLQRTSATLASSYTYVNPVIGLLLGVTLGGEQVAPREWLGAGVAVAGVCLLLVGQARRSRRG